jgi:hypothetical protein
MELLEGMSGLVTYLSLKLGGYLLWSYVGVRWLSRDGRKSLSVAVGLGIGRLILGWGTGLAVAPFVLVAAGLEQLPVFYFTGLAMVRWLEWGVIHCLIPGGGGMSAGFLTGGSARGRVWRVVGVLVSYLADAPFLVTQGFPHGRIFC